ncbi:hypothetical protein WN51_08482 [Melipona quadrifasciata]|uniref:Uncharacterized protein n=1 Tax=Melipona quadrifasciata TaxID=166423 RepID=A0A0M9A9K0_9HYME|nr:hypothetical protein WN51_08482 [Melipona quadrifasciata]
MDVYSSWQGSRAPQGPLKRMSSEFLRTAGKIGNGSLGKKGSEFSVIATGAPRVITSRRTVTDCAKTIKERDSGLEISERSTCNLYDGRQQDDLLQWRSCSVDFGRTCLIACESTDICSIPNGIADKFFVFNANSDERRREYRVKEKDSRVNRYHHQVLQRYRVWSYFDQEEFH